jgi:hypothetical protein
MRMTFSGVATVQREKAFDRPPPVRPMNEFSAWAKPLI